VTHDPRTKDGGGPHFRNARSPEYLALHGLPPDAAEEPHEAWEGRIHREDRERVAAGFLRTVEGPGDTYAAEYRIVTPAGDLRWISARAEVERDAAGRATRVRGVHLDVTDLRRTEARLAENELALAAAEQRLRLALEAGDLVAWEVDTVTGVGTASAGHFRLLGLPMPEGGHSFLRDWERVLLPEDRPLLDAARERAMHGDGTYAVEIRIRRGDGAIRWISSVGRRVPGTSRVIGVYADITERKAAEDLLRARVREAVDAAEAAQAALAQARKLEALGHLTGGVAHDFNNLLQVVTSGVTLLASARPSPPTPGALRLLDGIAGAGERGASLVARMLAFARRQDSGWRRWTPPPSSARCATSSRARSAPRCRSNSTFPPISAVRERRDDVARPHGPEPAGARLLNLCVNARDAMPPERFPDGRVRIAVRHVASAESGSRKVPPEPGDWASSPSPTPGRVWTRTPWRARPSRSSRRRRWGAAPASASRWCTASANSPAARSASTARRGGAPPPNFWLPRAAEPDGPAPAADEAPAAAPARRLAVLVVGRRPPRPGGTAALVGDLGHAATRWPRRRPRSGSSAAAHPRTCCSPTMPCPGSPASTSRAAPRASPGPARHPRLRLRRPARRLRGGPRPARQAVLARGARARAHGSHGARVA
jgi:PAS domain S-box-containing protein